MLITGKLSNLLNKNKKYFILLNEIVFDWTSFYGIFSGFI